MRKIIFKHRRAIGDALMFTSGIRDFKILFPEIEINVDTNFPTLFENNPYINNTLTRETPDIEYYNVGYPAIQNSNATINHFSNSFLFDMIAQADSYKSLNINVGEFCSTICGGRVGDSNLHETNELFKGWRKKYKNLSNEWLKKKGDIHLTVDEKNNNIIKTIFNIDKYWVIAPGGKSDCICKIWDWRKFQKVVDYFDGKIKFVSIGKSGHILEKSLHNIIDLTDKLSIREIMSLVYNADGCISGVSFLMHLAAAMPLKRIKPCIAIYGGREPLSFTQYEGHQVLHTIGSLSCCVNGGCWQSQVIPNTKEHEGERVCMLPVQQNEKIIQTCMDNITSDDVIRSIEKYYDGNILKHTSIKQLINTNKKRSVSVINKTNNKVINLLGSLSSKGGGEQSLIKIRDILVNNGWTVYLYAWNDIHDVYKSQNIEPYSFISGDMVKHMRKDIPLLFYANDQINDFCDESKTRDLVNISSTIIIGINYMCGALVKAKWLEPKTSAIIFQNAEKKAEFCKQSFLFNNVNKIILYGAISLDKFIQLPVRRRNKDTGEIVVLKHCTPDYRKYTTLQSEKMGDKIHTWQKNIHKENDIRFYTRLLADTSANIKFEFMEAHHELANHFKNEKRMVFHKFDSMSVEDFLLRGHIYLYRTSNAWRDQYPRCVAEALASGIPVLSEPRDGTMDRIVYGETGFYCIDYDAFLYSLKLLYRKEDYRYTMGKNAKEWARDNLDPNEWNNILEDIIDVKS